MLTIERNKVERDVQIGDLFNELGFTYETYQTDDSGDSVIDVREWNIETLSDDGYALVEAFRWTKPESMVVVTHIDDDPDAELLQSLICSPDHLIGTYRGWVKVRDLRLGEKLICKDQPHIVIEVHETSGIERLCDLQVAKTHSYYANDVLSHNSHFLVELGANALKQGFNVLHYTLELSEVKVGMRYDSYLCDIDANDVLDRKDEIIKKYEKMKDLGRLIIKQYPMNVATIYTIRSHIERCRVRGFVPNVIMLDYADVMRSTRQFDSLRHELKLVYEELRGYADEIGIPLWTACFHGDTVIKTPCGDAKIRDLVGKSGFPVYSYNHATGRVELKTVQNVYRSGNDVPVWKVTLDNGESVVVTPNHKFMKRDGTYCEVRDLHVGDSLMPFNERTSKGTLSGRKQIYRNDGSWEFAYKMVGEWKWGQIPKLHQIHHKDLDKMNDDPDNLELLTISEHYKIHSRSQWDPHNPCSLDHLRDIYSERMKQNNPMFSHETRQKVSRSRKGKCVGDANPMRRRENQKKVSESLRKSSKFAAYRSTVSTKVATIWANRDDDERKRIARKVQMSRFRTTRDERIKDHIRIALQCQTFDEYKEKTAHIPLRGGDKSTLWRNRNHTVVSIEPYGRADVFNMEVDELHNYAIGAGIIVKNSQSNKEGSNNEIVDLGNMSEAYGKAMVADVVISISRRTFEKATGYGRLYIAKNRAGRDGLVYPVRINTARSRFEVTGNANMLEEANKDDETIMKTRIRSKLKSIAQDKAIDVKGKV